jgi:hypothetical protein
MVPSFSHSGNLNAPGAQHHNSLETPSSPSSYSGAGTSSEELYGVMPGSPAEYGLTHSLINRDNFRRRYNMDGIAEVLLALERIEQDVELTHEDLQDVIVRSKTSHTRNHGFAVVFLILRSEFMMLV